MKLFFAFLLAVTLSNFGMAQGPGENVESRIESQKVAFITNGLELTAEEAQLFWPIYNEYQVKLKDLRRNNKLDLKKDNYSDEDAEKFLNAMFEKQQEELNIKKEYSNKLRSAIPVKKVAKLFVIEKKFRDEIISRVRGKMRKKKRKGRRSSEY